MKKMKKRWLCAIALLVTVLIFWFRFGSVFRPVLTPFQFLVFAFVTAAAWTIFYYCCIAVPCASLVKAINRVIQGDYHARFSCWDKNFPFKAVSASFNRLITLVEKQTNELTETRHTQILLYENEKVYRNALELTCMRVLEADITHNKILYGQDIYKRSFPFIQTEIYNELINAMAKHVVHPQDRTNYVQAFCREAINKLANTDRESEVTLEYRQKGQDGGYIWVSATVVLINNKNDQTNTVIGYTKNIDERKRNELSILMQSQRDGLTGLFNKKVTQEFIQAYLLSEGRGQTHAAIMLDIDNFKSINDTLGHMQGDLALTFVSEQLKKLFRDTDIIGRIGGDEFFILIKNVQEEILKEKLKTLCTQLNSIILDKNLDYNISGSIGVALYPRDGQTYSELYKNTDLALYYSKNHGKNSFCFYRSELDKRASSLPEKFSEKALEPISSIRV